MERDTVYKTILALAVLGLVVAGYQTYEHYYLSSGICDLSSTFSCSIVTESRFGELPQQSGIAVAAWGVLWWLGVIGLGYSGMKGREWLENQEFYLFAYIAAGLGFVAYLLTVELHILPQETGKLVICPFCTVQHVLIVILVFLSYTLLDKPITSYLTDIFYREE